MSGRGRWNREIWQRGTILQGWTSLHRTAHVRTAPVTAQHQCEAIMWRLEAHFATVVRGCCRGCRCRFRRPLKLSLLARAPTCPRLVLAAVAAAAVVDPRVYTDCVWAPTEWLTARRNCSRLLAPLSNRDKQDLIRLSFSMFDIQPCSNITVWSAVSSVNYGF